MRYLIIFIILMGIFDVSHAITRKTLSFDSSLSLSVVGDQIPAADVKRSLRYADRLYSEKKTKEVRRLCRLLLDNYNGPLTPNINFLNSKALFMEGKYDQFFESYKKNYILFVDSKIVRSSLYRDTLKRAIKFAINKKYDSALADYSHIKTLVQCYALLVEIEGRENQEIKGEIVRRMSSEFSFEETVFLEKNNPVGVFPDSCPGRLPGTVEELDGAWILLACSDAIDKIKTKFKSNLNFTEKSFSKKINYSYVYTHREFGPRDLFGRRGKAKYVDYTNNTGFDFLLEKKVPLGMQLNSKELSAFNDYLSIQVNARPSINSTCNVKFTGHNCLLNMKGKVLSYKLTIKSWEPILLSEKGSLFEWATNKGLSNDLL